jgi:MFS family permease
MRRFRSNIPRLLVFECLVSLHFMGGVLVPFFSDWGHLRYSEILLLQSIFSIALTVFEIPTGVFADRVGRKHSLALSAAITGLATLVYSARPQFALFVLGEILWALGVALASGADQALLYDSLKAEGRADESKRLLGLMSGLALVALAVAAPVGSAIGSTLGLRYSVMLMAIPMFLATLLAGTLRDAPRTRGERPESAWKMFLRGLQLIRTNREVRWLVAEQLAVGTPAFFVIWTYQLRLKELGVPLAAYGWVHAALAGAQFAILGQLGRVERLAGGKDRYLFWSAVLPGLAFLFLGLGAGPGGSRLWTALNVAAMIVIAGLGLSRRTLINSYLHLQIESEIRATALSTVNMLSRLLLIVLYPLVGLGAENSLSGALLALGVVILGSRALLFKRSQAP